MSNLDELIDSEEFKSFFKEITRKRKKYYWNDAIQPKDKANDLNLERRKFNPSVIIQSNKRIGINKRKSKFSSNVFFNQRND